MRRFLTVIILSLFSFSYVFAEVVPGSEWKEVHKQNNKTYLIDMKSIVMAGDPVEKENFYFLWIITSNKNLAKKGKVLTILQRDQVNCKQKKSKQDLLQAYDVSMFNGLTNKGNTTISKKYENANWKPIDSQQIYSKLTNIICLRYLGQKMSNQMKNDPKMQEDFKKFLEKEKLKKK